MLWTSKKKVLIYWRICRNLPIAIRRLNVVFFKDLFYVNEFFACMYINVPRACRVCWGQKTALDHLELESQTIVSHNVDAGNPTHVLHKGSQCSTSLSYHSKSLECSFKRLNLPNECSWCSVRLSPKLWNSFLTSSPVMCCEEGELKAHHAMGSLPLHRRLTPLPRIRGLQMPALHTQPAAGPEPGRVKGSPSSYKPFIHWCSSWLDCCWEGEGDKKQATALNFKMQNSYGSKILSCLEYGLSKSFLHICSKIWKKDTQ